MSSSSILTSVKKSLGLAEDMVEFDMDVIMAINTALNVLTQLGVGPENGFQIEDSSSIWSDFTGRQNKKLNMVKTYVYTKTRLIFDPPMSTSVQECMKETIRELEFRLMCEVDPKFVEEGGDENGIDDCS